MRGLEPGGVVFPGRLGGNGVGLRSIMRLQVAKVPQLAREIVDALLAEGDIEAPSPDEVRSDVESVLAQYARDEADVTERARELQAKRGLGPGELGRLRHLVAEEKHIRIGDEAIDYLLDQLVEMLMHSSNVEEVWSEDVDLRRHMREPLRRQDQLEEQLQAEVRGKLRHVQEGTAVWEVEYRRVMEDIKRRKGL